jgi:hypothetical protein
MIPSSDEIQKDYGCHKNRSYSQTGLIISVTRTLSPVTQIWWKSPGPDYAGNLPIRT